MERDSKLSKLNKHPVIVLLAAVIISFIIFEFAYMPHDYENLGGKHVWVSGSTIKFVNMWLEEGAANLHFTNYEAFPSIEFSTMEDRTPYVSYPTGVTWMVWSAAKICGRSRIDVSFLKHYQMLLYAIENILMTLLIYVIVSKIVASASTDDKQSSLTAVIVAYIISLFWMTLPVNNWFMTNIFWTDIAVLFWVIAFWLLESITDTTCLEGRWNRVAIALKILVIFAGVMTEYFFCIVVFVAFLINILRVVLKEKEKGHWFGKTFFSSLQYIIPVLTAIGIYVWQMSYTNNWLDKLLETFLHRTGAEDNEASVEMFIENFCQAIVCGSRKRMLILVVGVAIIVVPTIVLLIKRKALSAIITSKWVTVLFVLIFTPIIQIVAFSNHSAIHQYAMVKVGFVVTGLLICMIYVATHINSKHFKTIYVVMVVASILLAMGYPGQTRKFYFEKYEERNYDIAKDIYDELDYRDVCFSYTYFVNIEPPMDICVAEKCVYKIEDLGELQRAKANLPDEARIIVVIDKNNVGSNDFSIKAEKTEFVINQERMCIEQGKVIYDDENCSLVDMTNVF